MKNTVYNIRKKTSSDTRISDYSKSWRILKVKFFRNTNRFPPSRLQVPEQVEIVLWNGCKNNTQIAYNSSLQPVHSAQPHVQVFTHSAMNYHQTYIVNSGCFALFLVWRTSTILSFNGQPHCCCYDELNYTEKQNGKKRSDERKKYVYWTS